MADHYNLRGVCHEVDGGEGVKDMAPVRLERKREQTREPKSYSANYDGNTRWVTMGVELRTSTFFLNSK